MRLPEKIKNSIRAYVLGDSLGVPYEFTRSGKQEIELFKSNGTYNKPAGTWSDDTSVLLCLLDAFSQENSIEVYKNNLKRWYYNGEFTIDGCFDIGHQTSVAIRRNFDIEESNRMGNGAMFYSLPLAIVSLFQSDVNIVEWCSITHNSPNCVVYAQRYMNLLKTLLESGTTTKNKKEGVDIISIPLQDRNPIEKDFQNKGDVINTYKLVLNEYGESQLKETKLSEDLLRIISLGEDTDTNAAFLGALLGMTKPVEEEDWKRVREYKYVDTIIDKFLGQF